MEYDKIINEHYNRVAAESGASPASTMADEITRRMETDIITGFVADVIRSTKARRLIDIGCGNGYTLSVLAERFPGLNLVGMEPNAALREIAAARLPDVSILDGDIRTPRFHDTEPFDILISQRLIVNLLDLAHQKAALDNILSAVRVDGALLFIEAFASGVDNLNEAREEFDLSPLSAAHHNLNLPDDFFDHPGLGPYKSEGWFISKNHFSTHYFVTRVLHAMMTKGKPFMRNSEFVRFFSTALPPGIGNYSPLHVHAFVRV